jgi:hypothetical protein
VSPVSASAVLAAASPAGGAPTEAIGAASFVAAFAIIFLLMGGLGHRGGLVPTLGWFERFAERISGQPAWASLPCGLAIASLISAVFGLYWDVSIHVDVGRDPGPLNNPAHWFILAGLYGIFASGFFAICLPREDRPDRPGPTSIRIGREWNVPLGGVLMCASGGFALIGFPLDDVWHRIFGQDVTLWGPTHLMLIGGAAMTLLGIAVIQVEVRRAVKTSGLPDHEASWVKALRGIAWPGGLLIGLSTFQLEFDLGVPQFQLIYHPMLIMLAAGVALVAARVWLGPGAAFGAVLFYLAMRGLLSVSVGGLGRSVAHFPLYIVEAALVEAAALVVTVKRPLRFGAICGALIGTIGLAVEWGWSHVWMPLPWPEQILGQVIGLGFAMAVAASLVGAWIGARLGSETIPHSPTLRWAALASAIVIAGLLAFPLNTTGTSDVSASVQLRDVHGGAQRTVAATVTMNPRDGADGANWLTATAWQGGGRIVDKLREIRPGVFQSNVPLPVYGEWKTMIRMHKGNAVLGLPIYAPQDKAIPVPAIGAPASFTRPFFSDKELLQREARIADPAVTFAAYGVVLGFTLLLLAAIAWALHRVGRTAGQRREPPPPPPATPQPETGGGGEPQPDEAWPARIPVAGISSYTGGR